eukprot:8690061-Pyramimonas_sp.AAC.1
MGCVRNGDSRANAAAILSGTSGASEAAVKGTFPLGARKESSWSTSSREVVSSSATDTCESSSTRRLHSPAAAVAATAAALPAPTWRVTCTTRVPGGRLSTTQHKLGGSRIPHSGLKLRLRDGDRTFGR